MNTSFPRLLATATLGLSLAACQPSDKQETPTGATPPPAVSLRPGPWRGVLAAQGQEIPFLFEVKTEASKPVVYLINKGLNGEERLRCNEISTAGDSTTIRLHVFDAALVVRADGQDKLKGVWVKYDSKTPYRVPLTAAVTNLHQKFFDEVAPTEKISAPIEQSLLKKEGAIFKSEFRDETGEGYAAVGIFKFNSKTGAIVGTFLTTTGDYRYLSGERVHAKDGTHLKLSTFDGSHAFLFDAVDNNALMKLSGNFYSGKSGHETWTAVLDPKAKLPDANTLTYLKNGERRLDFKFPSVFEGGSVSPTDPKYQGKVLVVQLLGSWCPNCMDETNFLAPWYEKNKARGVEIIGLGYERSGDYKVASARLRNMRKRLNIGYDLAVAGVSDKDSVAKSLPQLVKFLAFPTTIFIDKKGNVRKIHTGFAGPGTGEYFQDEVNGFKQEVEKLLKE